MVCPQGSSRLYRRRSSSKLEKKLPKQTSVPYIRHIIAGSVRRIQKDKPADTSNWLPDPVGHFNLTMRLYGPETPILDGSYRLPAVKRVQ